MLTNLKSRFAPADYARKQELTIEWRKQCSQPKRGTEIEPWLQHLETLYDECTIHKIPEVLDEWPIHGFLAAIQGISPTFSETWELKVIDGARPSFKDLVSKLRDYLRITGNRPNTRTTHGAFEATLNGLNKDGQKPRDGQKEKPQERKPPRECLCGKTEYLDECPYLIEELRTSSWNPDPNTLKKVEEALEAASPGLKRAIEQAKARVQKRKSKSTQESTTTKTVMMAHRNKRSSSKATHSRQQAHTPKNNGRALTTTSPVASTTTKNQPIPIVASSSKATLSGTTTPQYTLYNSFILDSGATDHIYNKRERFSEFRKAHPDDTIYAGDSIVPIEGWGSIRIVVKTPTLLKYRTLDLHDVAYIPSFNTNIVALHRLMKQNVHWDTKKELVQNDEIFCYTPFLFEQFVLEYTPLQGQDEYLVTSKTEPTDSPSMPSIFEASSKASKTSTPQVDSIDQSDKDS
jgi:hypothetical protein